MTPHEVAKRLLFAPSGDMRVRYDTQADVAAFDLIYPGAVSARTVQIDEGTLVDLDHVGRVVSIEVIQPGQGWPLEDILERFSVGAEDRKLLEWWAETFEYVRGVRDSGRDHTPRVVG